MAIQGNQQTESASGKKYYGIGTFKVVGFNLNLQELEKLGVKYKAEPQYTNIELGGKTVSKVVVYLKNEKFDVIRRVEYLISNEDRKSEKGSYQIINNINQTTWSSSIQECLESYSWFKDFGARIAKTGEVDLMTFITNWVNYIAKTKDSENYTFCSLESFDKLVKGDVTELNTLLKSFNVNEIKLLVYIKNGYESIYGKVVGRSYTKFEGQYGIVESIRKQTASYALDGVVTYAPYAEYTEGLTLMDDTDDYTPSEDEIPNF